MTAKTSPSDQIERTVHELRRQWKPYKERLNRAGHPLPIRMHRAFSWLAQAEVLDRQNASVPKDDDSILILRWIAFNALYGRWDSSEAEPEPDRKSLRRFLKQLDALDEKNRIANALQQHRSLVEQLCTDRYVHDHFWKSLDSDHSFDPKRSEWILKRLYRNQKWRKILDELIERVYLVRCQLVHGAATHGGRLNRDVVRWSGTILKHLLPTMIEVIVDSGSTADWGDLCYPPLNSDSRPRQPR